MKISRAKNLHTLSERLIKKGEEMKGLRIAGFCTALFSLVVNPFGLISIPAVVMSLAGMDGEEDGIAIAGVVIGAFATIYNIIIVNL